MERPATPVARKPSWRDLPPHPPYGPVPPPRPPLEETRHGLEGSDSGEGGPAAPSPAGGKTALIVGGLILALAAGVGLGLVVTGDDSSLLAGELGGAGTDRPAPEPPGVVPNPQPPGGYLPRDLPLPQPDAGTASPPSSLGDLQSLLDQLREELGVAPGDPLIVPRLFDVTYLPDGYQEVSTTVRRQNATSGNTAAEQTSVLSGPSGEIAIRATQDSDAREQLDELRTQDGVVQTQVAGHAAYRLNDMRLAWLGGEDLLIEVDVPAGLADGELEQVARGVRVAR